MTDYAVAWGIASFTAVWGFLKASSLFVGDEADDTISRSLKTAMKMLFLGGALWMIVMTVGNIPQLTNAVIASDPNLNDVSQITTFLDANNAQYNLAIRVATWMFLPFFFIFLIYMIFRNIQNQLQGGEDGQE